MPHNAAMFRRRATILFLFIATLAAQQVLAGDIRWKPQKTWVFVIGTLEWKDSEAFASFPKANRRDAQLVRFFRQKGVRANHIVYLADKQATTSHAQAALDRMLAQTATGDLLFFYFTGHGYQSEDGKKTFFATYDASDNRAGWNVDAIVGTIARKFRGDRVILAADCCYSGALVDRVRRTRSRQSFACFASSTSKDSSTADWTFTEMLPTPFIDPERPVVAVSWFDAVAYCDWLSGISGRRVRLPYEAEWECAARGGAEGMRYPWGNELPHDDGHWVNGPEPVGRRSPNAYGLHDVCENVHEWCSDWYAPDFYAVSPERNPRGPESGKRRVSRGGSWRHRVKFSRCAARSSIPPEFQYADYGFRIACQTKP